MASMMVQEWKLLEQLSDLFILAPRDRAVVSCAYMREVSTGFNRYQEIFSFGIYSSE